MSTRSEKVKTLALLVCTFIAVNVYHGFVRASLGDGLQGGHLNGGHFSVMLIGLLGVALPLASLVRLVQEKTIVQSLKTFVALGLGALFLFGHEFVFLLAKGAAEFEFGFDMNIFTYLNLFIPFGVVYGVTGILKWFEDGEMFVTEVKKLRIAAFVYGMVNVVVLFIVIRFYLSGWFILLAYSALPYTYLGYRAAAVLFAQVKVTPQKVEVQTEADASEAKVDEPSNKKSTQAKIIQGLYNLLESLKFKTK